MNPMTLHPEHLEDLRIISGLTDETIQAAGIYTVPPDEIGQGKNRKGLPVGVMSALAFPYPGCGGFERFKVWWDEGRQGEKPKYLQKTETPNHLYFPPTADLQGDGTLMVVEGEKKALVLWQVGLSGGGPGRCLELVREGPRIPEAQGIPAHPGLGPGELATARYHHL